MSDRPRAALIFAAGFGTRMRPLTNRTPKPMLEVGGRPLIDRAIDLVRAAGIDHIVANTHYLADRITPHLEAQGIVVSHEPEILETGGGLRAALPLLGPGPVLTLNPDVAWTGANPVAELLSAWQPGLDALLLLQPTEKAEQRVGPGDFDRERDGRLTRGTRLVYTGAQIIDPTGLAAISETAFSLNTYWDRLTLRGTLHDGGWCDIGRPEGLARARDLLADA